ncbi:BatD family protein [Mesonia aquimarina]|uniref:BatD family protein n=1 Tax=Mesonia aquimarina TaxID=1504967 RepID=UPI000EF5A2CF|nr:BatD family protein [Mesonia aquimarina]
MKKNSKSYFAEFFRSLTGFMILLFLFFVQTSTRAQEVSAKIDSTSIKIGEQITYQIKVETDSTDQVIFPEGQSFIPLEMVTSLKVDTTSIEKRFQLIKEYNLTQFDSGNYTIPRQRILINNSAFFTDSLQVQVKNVVVDTTKQKLYPIKPSLEIEESFSIPSWFWWLLGIIILLAILTWFLLKQKKKRDEAKKEIPPYDKAMLTLKKLDESDVLERGDVKSYYSDLTDAVRRYLDEKIDDRALESTTNELIAILKDLKNSNKLYLKESVIASLEAILKRADLAKFAGIKPDRLTAKEDRKTIGDDIEAFKTAIPEPSEEELLKDKAYQEKIIQQKRKRKIWAISIASALIVLVGLGAFIGIKGLDYAKNLVIQNSAKELLEGDWVQSEYGYPAVSIITPEVLVRENPDSITILPTATTEKQAKLIKENFAYGQLEGELYVRVFTMSFGRSPAENSFGENPGENGAKQLEEIGAKNILFKQEKFVAADGVEGLKVHGSFSIKNPITGQQEKKNYVSLYFGAANGNENVFVSYADDNEDLEEISNRIINSVEFNSNKNAGLE